MGSRKRKYVVDRIIDGDTFVVRNRKTKSKSTVRIACIDTPEMNEGNCGQIAKDFLTGLIPVGSRVGLRFHDRDRYGRSVCEVYAKSKLVNVGKKLVSAGMAEVYDDYAYQCNEKKLYRAQKKAYKDKRGFWGFSSAKCSFNWSKSDAKNAKNEDIQVNNKFGVKNYTGSRDITCSQIFSIDEAYAWLRAGHGYLDGDNDGIPCESLL